MEYRWFTEITRDLECLFRIVFETLSLVMIYFLKVEEFSTVYESKDILISLKVQTH